MLGLIEISPNLSFTFNHLNFLNYFNFILIFIHIDAWFLGQDKVYVVESNMASYA